MSISTKSVSFIVPIDYQVPSEFQRFADDVVSISLALDIASHALIQLRNKTTQALNNTLYEELRNQATFEYEKKLSQAKKENEQAEARIAVLRAQIVELQGAITTVRQEVRQEERERTTEMLADKEHQIRELQDTHRQNSVRILDSFQSLRQDWVKQQSQMQLQSQLSLQNSSIKGKQAELTLADLLIQAFGTTANGEEFTVSDTGKSAYSADILMGWMNTKIMWESKDYKEQVNTKEVQKFRRDLELNKEVVLGVMVSFHSGITGHMKAGNFDLETLPDGRFAIYVSNLAESGQSPLSILQSLRPFMEVFVADAKRRRLEVIAKTDGEVHTSVSDTAIETAELSYMRKRQECIEKSLGILNIMINKHIKTLTESRNELHVWQKKNEQMFGKFHTDIREQEQYAKQIFEEITGMASYLLGKDEEIAGSKSGRSKLDTLVFTNANFDDYDPREKTFIENCLAVAEIQEDTKTSTKDFRDALMRKGNYTEGQINSLRVKVFQPAVWEAGARNVRHLKLNT